MHTLLTIYYLYGHAITLSILTNVLNSISERFGSIFKQINISPTVTAITVACILIYYLDNDLPMACNRQSSSWARILLLHPVTHSLTHSLTQLDSIVAYASIAGFHMTSLLILLIFYFNEV